MNINMQGGYGGGCCGCILQLVGLAVVLFFVVTFCGFIGG